METVYKKMNTVLCQLLNLFQSTYREDGVKAANVGYKHYHTIFRLLL